LHSICKCRFDDSSLNYNFIEEGRIFVIPCYAFIEQNTGINALKIGCCMRIIILHTIRWCKAFGSSSFASSDYLIIIFVQKWYIPGTR